MWSYQRPETTEVTPESSERIEGGDTIRDTDSERVWDKRGLNERSVPWDPPKLPSSEESLMEPQRNEQFVQQQRK